MVTFSASTIDGPLISCRKTCLGPKWSRVVQRSTRRSNRSLPSSWICDEPRWTLQHQHIVTECPKEFYKVLHASERSTVINCSSRYCEVICHSGTTRYSRNFAPGPATILPVFQRALLRQYLHHHQLPVIRQCDDRASFVRTAHNDFAGMNVMRSESVKERMGLGKVGNFGILTAVAHPCLHGNARG